MRISKREKALLIILAFIIGGYVVFQHIIRPQLVSLNEQIIIKATLESKKQRLTDAEERVKALNEELIVIETKIQSTGNQYFSSLRRQEETIVVLNELLLNTGINNVSIFFEDLSEEHIGETLESTSEDGISSLLVQKVYLSYESSYDQLLSLLHAIWGYQKHIAVTDIIVNYIGSSSDGSVALSGEVSLSFYDFSNMTDADGESTNCFEDGTLRKANPFNPINDEVLPEISYVISKDYDN